MFRHPKYYKELRKLRNKTDQAISQANSTRGLSDVRSGPGPKPQATSSQASSGKRQAPSRKRQASSRKLQADES
jgi:hypothetical protein